MNDAQIAIDKEDYNLKLAKMTDEELQNEVAERVWFSGFAANNPRSKYHWQCDATYTEAQRRKKPWIYCAGWNRTYVENGGVLSDREIQSAKPPAPADVAARA